MFDAREFEALAQLPEPLLTVYLDTNPGLPTNCRAIPGYMAWLKTEARDLLARVGESKSSLLYAQVQRVERYLDQQRPAHTGVLIFAGPTVWQVLPLHVDPTNQLHWGKPDLWQLISIADQHRPMCAVVVDHSGARLYISSFGVLTQFAEQEFKIDVSQWKEKEHAHMARRGTRMPHGAQRDLYERRVEGEYLHLLHEVGKTIEAYCDTHSIDQIFLLGTDRLTKQIELGLEPRLRGQVTRIQHASLKESARKTLARIEASIQEHELARGERSIAGLLNRTRGTVTGVDQTLNQLQRGRLDSLLLADELNPILRQCGTCRFVTASASRHCPVCNAEQSATTLHEILPALLTRHACRMELVEGSAAARLRSAGSIGGRLRTFKDQRAYGLTCAAPYPIT